ncbi:MAG: Rieske (2Fe-2S) protein [Caldilineaceae bacterium]|nr:Rieske (2Fe-2S) protein [Caldilineaceae bacterium]
MTQVVIAKIWEIPPGSRKIVVPFRGRAGIGVFNVNGDLYALRNICPHKRGPLCTGELTGHIKADAPPSAYAAELAVDGDGEVLRCPWHQWPFEIATGRCLVDPKVRVKTYPVRVIGNDIIVDLGE